MLLDERMYYVEKRHEHGESVESLGWSEKGQQIRFAKLANQIRFNICNDTILDVGCGHADLYLFLSLLHGFEPHQYFGIDAMQEAIDCAREKYPKIPVDNLSTLDLDSVVENEFKPTWIFCSGTMSFKSEFDTMTFIGKMWEMSEKGIAFNCLSSLKDKGHVTEDPVIWKDPSAILKFCMTLTRNVRIDHSYLPHDFTIQMFKDIQ